MMRSSSSEPVGSVVKTCFARAHSLAKPTLRSAHLRSSLTRDLRELVQTGWIVGPEQLDAILAGLLRAIQRLVGAAHQVDAVGCLALGIRGNSQRRGDRERARRIVVGGDAQLRDSL